MKRVKTTLALVLSLGISTSALSQIVSAPTLTASGISVFCDGYQPYVTFTLQINGADRGRPGLIYVGMHDEANTSAMFLTGNEWTVWQSGLFPPYQVARSGLVDQRITIPLNPYLAGGGWRLYAGYGALSTNDEARVQAYTQTIDKVKLVTGKPVASIDHDHYRRTLVQADLAASGKYAFVQTGVEYSTQICQPQ
ncbi:hypothetical protein [Agrobacterium tumefaciens]|uniref:hypothetical protein n=1 Tax=Agrobacterium tumefaciens TaxID=358 RepID=UPI001573D743|nr:hypothetical protein [Agrobacterium tumefaciens]NTB05922.1 hypothetical protein [Agrobacterium tumefaciens]